MKNENSRIATQNPPNQCTFFWVSFSTFPVKWVYVDHSDRDKKAAGSKHKDNAWYPKEDSCEARRLERKPDKSQLDIKGKKHKNINLACR